LDDMTISESKFDNFLFQTYFKILNQKYKINKKTIKLI